MSLIPGRGIRVSEKILATPSVGVGGKTQVHRYKRADWASRKGLFILSLSFLSFKTFPIVLTGYARV